MRTSKEHRTVQQSAVYGVRVLSVLLAGAGVAVAQPPSPGKEAIRPGGATLTDTAISRNSQVEDGVAARLKAERFDRNSRILVLGTSNRVYLIGVVPSETIREQAILSAGQTPGVRGVADHLVVLAERPRKADARLQRDIDQGLRPVESRLGNNIRVRTYKGDALLDGSVSRWEDMAEAMQAAFAAGARYVVSDLTLGSLR